MTAETTGTIDTKALRNALGSFTTGVTIITARASEGTPVGITANSFNSVSLDPPMVLWSLAKDANSLPVYSEAEYWAVHVLAASQEELSNRFARRGEDKFSGLDIEEGYGGVPLLRNCTARFQCRTSFQYEGGDHIIFVGEVVDFEASDEPPLVFQAGKYALATSKSTPVSLSRFGREGNPDCSFDEDFLGYLLGRAHYQMLAKTREYLRERDLSDGEFFALSVLGVRDGRTQNEIDELISYTGFTATDERLQNLESRGLIWAERCDDGRELYFLTEEGRKLMLRISAVAKSIESDLLGKLGWWEGIALKNLLKELIVRTDPGLPDLWAPDDGDAG